jgi:hypothetical protein
VQFAASLPSPGACLGGFSWNAATIGGGESTFSGVLAGFGFTGIVTILALGVIRRHREAAAGLKLLLCAFLGLTVATYLLVLQSADENCLRAISEGTIFGSILGTFVIIMLVALTWLVTTSERHEHGVLQFLRQLINVGTGLVVLLICTSSFSYLRAAVPNGPPQATVVGIYLVGGLLYVAGLPGVVRLRVHPLSARTHLRTSSNTNSGAQQTGGTRMWTVDVCAWLALCYLAVAAVCGSLVAGTTDRAWDPRPVHVIYIIAWSSVVAPLCVLVSALRACAPDPAPREDDAVSREAESAIRAGADGSVRPT